MSSKTNTLQKAAPGGRAAADKPRFTQGWFILYKHNRVHAIITAIIRRLRGEDMTNKKVTSVVLYFVIFVVAMGLTVGVLYVLRSLKPVEVSQSLQQQMPRDVVDTIVATPPESLNELIKAQPETGELSVSARPAGAEYTILIPSQAGVTFSSNQPDSVAASDTILSESDAIFGNLGFTRESASSDGSTYVNGKTTCQVSIQKAELAVVSYACIDTAKIAEENEALENLVTLHDSNASGDQKIKAPTQLSRVVLQKDAVTGAVLYVTYASSDDQSVGARYIFGAIDSNWEYVADISTLNDATKSNLPKESTNAISNAKWNGLLVELTDNTASSLSSDPSLTNR